MIEEMKCKLETWFLEYVDPAVDGTREAVTGDGQCGPAGPAGRGEKAFMGGVKLMSEN